MSRVKITLEDLPNGNVKIVSDPSFDMLMKVVVNSEDLTSAQGYAIFALNQIRAVAKQGNPTLLIPRRKMMH